MKRFFILKYLIIIIFVSVGNIFAQIIKVTDYEIVTINNENKNGFYFTYFKDNPDGTPSPFSPSIEDFNFKFGIEDSSFVSLTIYSVDKKDTILRNSTILLSGNYYLNWVVKNYRQLKFGSYVCSIEVTQFHPEVINLKSEKLFKIIFY